MRTLLSRIALAAAVTFLVIAGSIDAHAERRVALVVGNSAYAAASLTLPNPINDAQDITTALKDLGFEVVTTTDATKRDMDLALQQFARLAISADAALFFYAGHAIQYQGRNYLMPTDAELQDEVSVGYEMVSLEYVRAALDRTKGVRIMILDACRNNPLAARLQGKSRGVDLSTRGLAPVAKTEGMVVAFATASDEVAQDGTGRNSPFTAALLKRIREPGVDIGIMLRRVANDVNTQTNGRQLPETQISLLTEYYLNQNDQNAWEHVNPDDEAALNEFLRKYPSSRRADDARRRLDVLERERHAREDEDRRLREIEERIAAEQKRVEELRQQKKKRDDEIAAQKRREEEIAAQRRREEEIAAQKRREEEIAAQKKREEEVAAQKRREEEIIAARKKREEEIAAQKKREEEIAAQKRRDEEIAAQKKRDEEIAAQKRRDEEIAAQKRRDAEIAAQKKREEEIAAQKRRDDEIAAQKRRDDEIAAQKRRDDEIAAQKRRDDEIAAQKKRDDEQKRYDTAALPPKPESPPNLVRVNLPEQIRQAQYELRRLGCFNGALDSRLNEATRDALSKYTHRPVVEINITDDFINDLKKQHDGFCLGPAPKPPAPKPPPVHHAEHPQREDHPQDHPREGGWGRPSPGPSPSFQQMRPGGGGGSPTIGGTGF